MEVKPGENLCTLPFELGLVVPLRGMFLDRMDETEKALRKATRGKTPQAVNNAEILIYYLRHLMSSV